MKMDDSALKQVPKFKYLHSILIEDGKNKEDTIQGNKEAKFMFIVATGRASLAGKVKGDDPD
jgi:hypothetical protein